MKIEHEGQFDFKKVMESSLHMDIGEGRCIKCSWNGNELYKACEDCGGGKIKHSEGSMKFREYHEKLEELQKKLYHKTCLPNLHLVLDELEFEGDSTFEWLAYSNCRGCFSVPES